MAYKKRKSFKDWLMYNKEYRFSFIVLSFFSFWLLFLGGFLMQSSVKKMYYEKALCLSENYFDGIVVSRTNYVKGMQETVTLKIPQKNIVLKKTFIIFFTDNIIKGQNIKVGISSDLKFSYIDEYRNDLLLTNVIELIFALISFILSFLLIRTNYFIIKEIKMIKED